MGALGSRIGLSVGFLAIFAFFSAGIARLWIGLPTAVYLLTACAALAAFGIALLPGVRWSLASLGRSPRRGSARRRARPPVNREGATT